MSQQKRRTGLWYPRVDNSVKTQPFGSSELGAGIKGLFLLGLTVIVALISVAFLFGTVIPIGHVGVRKIAFGPGQGLASSSLKPGYHWTIPGYSAIYVVPQTVQLIDFDRAPLAGGSFGALNVPTVDGTTLDVDVTLFTRFYPSSGSTAEGAPHGGPSDLIIAVGPNSQQWRKYLSQVAENELKRALSALSTVDFYNPEKREKQVKVAEEEMKKILAPLGVELIEVLLRRYTYREEIDQAIFKKNLQELEISFNKVASEFAEAQKEVNKVDSEGSVAITNLQKQAVAEVQKIRSEGDLYVREKKAEADLLVARARADVDKLKNQVLTYVGSDVYVALQLAKILSSFKGGVVNGVNPYDFDGWVKRLSGTEPLLGSVLPTETEPQEQSEVEEPVAGVEDALSGESKGMLTGKR